MSNASDESLAAYIQQLEAENNALEEQKRALIEEFAKSLPSEYTAADLQNKMREDVLPTAYARFKFLIEHAESESVQAGLIKFAFNYVKDLERGKEGNDEFADLLKQLTATT